MHKQKKMFFVITVPSALVGPAIAAVIMSSLGYAAWITVLACSLTLAMLLGMIMIAFKIRKW